MQLATVLESRFCSQKSHNLNLLQFLKLQLPPISTNIKLLFPFYVTLSAVILFIVREDTLQDMVKHMSDRTGIVHQMPFTCDRAGFAATLEKVTFQASLFLLYQNIECFRFILGLRSPVCTCQQTA